MHLIAEAERTPSGVPPTPQSRSMPVFGITANSEAATSPSEMKRMLAPTSRRASTASSWRGRSSMITVTSLGRAALALGDPADHVLERIVEAEQVGRPRAGRDLLHVDAGARVEHGAALREGDHRERRGHASRGQRGPLQRVDGDVDARRAAVADLLAVVEHRRLVLLALADHDDAVHRHRVEHQAHRVDGRAVGALLLARPTQRPAASAPASVTRTSSSARLRSGCEGSRTSCEITCSSASGTGSGYSASHRGQCRRICGHERPPP